MGCLFLEIWTDSGTHATSVILYQQECLRVCCVLMWATSRQENLLRMQCNMQQLMAKYIARERATLFALL